MVENNDNKNLSDENNKEMIDDTSPKKEEGRGTISLSDGFTKPKIDATPPPSSAPAPSGNNGDGEKPKNKKRNIIIIAASAVLVLALIIGGVIGSKSGFNPNRPDGIYIGSTGIGDFVDTGEVMLSGLESFSLDEIKNGLTFEPIVDFEIEKSGNDFTVKFRNQRNVAYAGTFKYTDKSGNPSQEVFYVNGPNHTVKLAKNKVERNDSITLRFNEQVDARSFAEHMTISPETEVEISYSLDSVQIYPADGWQLTSNYQIEISKDYTAKTGKEFSYDQLLKFSVVKPDDEGGGFYYPEIFYHNDDNFIITEDVKIAISFTGQALPNDVPLVLETYRIGDVNKFKEQSKIYLDYDVEMDSLEKLDTQAFAVQEGDNKFELNNPGEGAYIVRAIAEDPNKAGEKIEFRTGYLITPYSLYLQSSRNETLAWLHNGKTNSPVEGYTVMFEDNPEISAKTDQSGIAVIPNIPEQEFDEESESDHYNYRYDRNTQPTTISIYDSKDNLVYFDDAKLRKEEQSQLNLYNSFFYLDRSLYRPTDTINFWGFVKPFRTNSNPMPKTVEVVFDEGGLDYRMDVEVNPSGVFTGSFDISKIKSSHYSVTANIKIPSDDPDSESSEKKYDIGNEYISVKNFQKPSFILTTEIDQSYYSFDDEVKVDVTATFYDGTPLPNYPIEAFYRGPSYGEWIEVDTLTTDDKGKASYTFKVQNNSYGDRVSSNSYRVKIANDGEDITNVGYYYYVAASHILEQNIKKNADGTNLEVEISTYALNLNNKDFIAAYEEKKNTSEYFSIYNVFYDTDILALAKGEPKDMSVDIDLRWDYVDKDNINHQNRSYNNDDYYVFENSYSMDFTYIPKYTGEIVDTWELKEKKITIETVNGKAIIKDAIFLPEGTTINFDKDVTLRSRAYSENFTNYTYYPGTAEYYDWSYWGNEEDSGRETLSFKVTRKEDGKDLTPSSRYYRNVSLDIDDPVNFQLMLNNEEVTKKGTILYSIIQGGLHEYKVVEANDFDFAYNMEFSPNALITAAYFDGYRVHYIDDLDIRATEESRSVTIEVTPDKESYRPGEVAKLSIKATDVNDKPVEGNMVVSVVDESIFALSEQYLDVLYDLNRNLWYLDNYVAKYCTTYRSGGANTALWDGGKGDGGEGGDFYDSYRSNFKDTAHFVSTRTNASGESTIEFTMPDNITSWRVTAIQIGDQMFAGSDTYNIITTQPFFVKPVTTSKYLDGDEISMLVQGHGTALSDGDEISYAVTLKGDNYEKTIDHKEKAYQAVEFNFGKLPIGTYTLVAKASFDGNSDTVEIPIYVIKNNLELVVNTPIDIPIDQPLSIEAARFPVSVSLYSEKNLPFFNTVNRLFGHYCMMPSQRMSRFTAKKVLSGTMEAEDIPYYIREGNDSISDMQQSDGGIGASSNTESELMLSLYLTLIEKEQFDQNSLAGYFRNQIENNNGKGENEQKARSAAYLGLAALGEVEKEELLEAFGVDEKGKYADVNMRADIKAYYITALSYIGEDKLAKQLYDKDLHNLIKIKNSVYVYSYAKEESLTTERDLAAIWIAASKINLDDANDLSNYFSSSSWMYRTLFEGMVYVVNYDVPVVTDSFTYTLNGETKTKKIGIQGMSTLKLDESQLKDIRFTKIDKGVSGFAYYIGEPEEIGMEDTEGMSVTKTVAALDENTYEVTIKLDLPKDSPTGVYDISDWIPSNSRLYQKHIPDSSSYSYMTNEEQKVYIRYHHNTNAAHTETITYKIRQTYAATAVLDRVYVIHGESGNRCSTQKEEFVPENSNINNPVVKPK